MIKRIWTFKRIILAIITFMCTIIVAVSLQKVLWEQINYKEILELHFFSLLCLFVSFTFYINY